MGLRPQQEILRDTVCKIKSGSPVKDIILYWSPGAGKSLAPVILSDLIDSPEKKIVVVVPRDSLKEQMEKFE